MTETIPAPQRPSADAILARSNAEAADVHSYALQEIGALELLIVKLKAKIEAKRAAREAANQAYIDTVDEAIRASRVLEEAVARIDEAVEET